MLSYVFFILIPLWNTNCIFDAANLNLQTTMKRILLLVFIFNTICLTAQNKAYGDGEWFKFRVHYGFVTAGYATLQAKSTHLNGKEVYHVRGEGKTVGLS